MAGQAEIITEGVSADWQRATGDDEPHPRGKMPQEALAEALGQLAALEAVPGKPAPLLLARGPGAVLGFVPKEGGLFCGETGQTLTPGAAAALVFASEPLSETPTQSPAAAAMLARLRSANAPPPRKKRGHKWQGVVLLLLAVLAFVAAALLGAMVRERGSYWPEGLAVPALLIAGIFALAKAARYRHNPTPVSSKDWSGSEFYAYDDGDSFDPD